MGGFFDKVKQAAGDVADAAKKGAGQVQTKAQLHSTRGKADDAARKLGYLIVRERTEGVAAGAEADELVARIVDLEKQIAEAETAPSDEPEASRGESAEAPSEEGGEASAG